MCSCFTASVAESFALLSQVPIPVWHTVGGLVGGLWFWALYNIYMCFSPHLLCLTCCSLDIESCFLLFELFLPFVIPLGVKVREAKQHAGKRLWQHLQRVGDGWFGVRASPQSDGLYYMSREKTTATLTPKPFKNIYFLHFCLWSRKG